MSLWVGDRLGPYEIPALIGKGGMGEVWKARDSRLNRDGAIKIDGVFLVNLFIERGRACRNPGRLKK
jgi:hypothetical protein